MNFHILPKPQKTGGGGGRKKRDSERAGPARIWSRPDDTRCDHSYLFQSQLRISCGITTPQAEPLSKAGRNDKWPHAPSPRHSLLLSAGAEVKREVKASHLPGLIAAITSWHKDNETVLKTPSNLRSPFYIDAWVRFKAIHTS